MSITALCYLGVRTQSLDQWSTFAGGILGMQQIDHGGNSTAYRMDDHKQRLVVERSKGNSLAFMGWEVTDQQSLERIASVLDAADVKVSRGNQNLCDQRFVTDLVYFNDPDGNRIELIWKPQTTTDPFTPGRPITGFNTGPYGMGHAVLHVHDANALLPFYRDLLGFNVSDYGLSPYPMYFFHVNGRHQSFAMIGSGGSGLHHFMVEFQNLDDVGQGYDLAQLESDRIAYTLGRHTNDYMTSFYAHTPSGFFVESGWGVFQAIGLAEEVVSNSPFNPGMRFVDNNGNLLLDWPRPREVGEHLWQSSFHFHQPDLEKTLRRGLERFTRVKIVSPANVVELQQRSNDVEVTYTHGENSSEAQTEKIQASFVVGCDGARSTVRKSMQSAVEDLGFRERWLVVDVLLNKDKPELGDYTIQYCNPDRPSTYVRGPGNRRRWEITIKDHEDETAMAATDSVWQLLQEWLDPQDAEIERKAVYTFHSMIASQWRSGRLLLAGDAAHQMPPFMGQGMCAGIRDVANLAWKLQACVQKKVDESLLDSYQSERSPHVAAYIDTAIKLGGLINTCDNEDALRLAFKPGSGSAKMKSIAPLLGDGLIDSTAVNYDTQHAGLLAPQPRMADQRKLDDVIGYRFVLVATEEVFHQLSGSESKLPILSEAAESGLQALLKRYECCAILIRPDRYILGTATNMLQVQALIDCAVHKRLLTQHCEMNE